jgi:NAD(P)H-hydrate epimerase
MNIPYVTADIPYLTADQMIEVDRLMIENYKIELIQMMENAGLGLAHLARARFFRGDVISKKVTVMAGTGGNGGGVMVCARRLFNYGARVTVCLSKPKDAYTGVPARQLSILIRMGVEVAEGDEIGALPGPDLIIDGIIGFSLRGAPRGTAGNMIRWANRQAAPVLALDVPSGVDATTGTDFDPAIKAAATMTLALPKAGLRASGVGERVGELYLADIGVPPALYAEPSLGLHVGDIFAESDIVRLK